MTEHVTALALYGSLIPGEKEHYVVRRIAGDWLPGHVQGFEFDITWGPAEGFYGFLPDDSGNSVPVMVLISDQIEKNLRTVDEFHGDGFDRQIIEVTLEDETVIDAWIYAALTDS